mmetsp:Transcript_19878/g.40404  ORF Transcript_19878/g.40404 Transcript_19878/m.40404 type:complete len:88 (-) Transcript_19878:2056-2319(-)
MSATPTANTYVAGDDPSRLRDAAAYLGLDRARRPTARVREVANSLLSDTTLESARMVRTAFSICQYPIHTFDCFVISPLLNSLLLII